MNSYQTNLLRWIGIFIGVHVVGGLVGISMLFGMDTAKDRLPEDLYGVYLYVGLWLIGYGYVAIKKLEEIYTLIKSQALDIDYLKRKEEALAALRATERANGYK